MSGARERLRWHTAATQMDKKAAERLAGLRDRQGRLVKRVTVCGCFECLRPTLPGEDRRTD